MSTLDGTCVKKNGANVLVIKSKYFVWTENTWFYSNFIISLQRNFSKKDVMLHFTLVFTVRSL